jgi:hypothetical protein
MQAYAEDENRPRLLVNRRSDREISGERGGGGGGGVGSYKGGE